MSQEELTLEDFDAMLEAETSQEIVVPAPAEPPGKHPQNKRDLVVNVEVAARLAAGETMQELAAELHVGMATMRKYVRCAPMKNLVAIEARRIVRHLGRRELRNVPYEKLANSAAKLIETTRILDEGSKTPNENRVITQTTIDQINVFISQRRDLPKGAEHSSDIQELDATAIPEISEESQT